MWALLWMWILLLAPARAAEVEEIATRGATIELSERLAEE